MQRSYSQITSIRKVSYKDVQQIVDLDKKLFGEGGYENFSIRQYIDLFPNSFFVCEKSGNVIGYTLLGIEALTKNAWLLSLGVSTEHQGKGIGRALTKACDDFCISTSMDRCRLTVEPDNVSAISLYRDFGFTELEHKKNYYKQGDKRLLMQKFFVTNLDEA